MGEKSFSTQKIIEQNKFQVNSNLNKLNQEIKLVAANDFYMTASTNMPPNISLDLKVFENISFPIKPLTHVANLKIKQETPTGIVNQYTIPLYNKEKVPEIGILAKIWEKVLKFTNKKSPLKLEQNKKLHS